MGGVMKTSTSTLEALFDALASELAKQIEEGKDVATKDGEIVRASPDASTLNVARQFLKDNGVEVVGEQSEGLRKLANVLPFTDNLDEKQAS